MYSKKINHLALVKDWDSPKLFRNSETLILGSFNPYNTFSEEKNADYYYGRQTNHLWKIIASLLEKETDYFFNNIDRKYEVMYKYKFCFMDVIDSIDISANENEILNEYISNNIFQNYLDQKLFTSKTSFKDHKIEIKRNYNQRVINILESKNLKKLIHTMGNNRIKSDFSTSPKEIGLGNDGFQNFIKSIKNHNIEFVKSSYSPSSYAVNKGGREYKKHLKEWMKKSLNL